MVAVPPLPVFVEPMLSQMGDPFDSKEHVFEIKWDGMRTLAFAEGQASRFVNRRRHDATRRYPELAFLEQMPPGCLLDGEIVILRGGRPDFEGLLSREQARTSTRARALAAQLPAVYVAFDILYHQHHLVMETALEERRSMLSELVAATGSTQLIFSEGVVGAGIAFFQQACAQELEGVVAKKLSSRYLPGRRTEAWTKIKRSSTVHCLVLGFVPEGQRDFKSLVLGTDVQGELRCCGRVGSGIDEDVRARLNAVIWERLRNEPLVPCEGEARWLEPGIYCTVTFAEWTSQGSLRAPRLKELIIE